MGQSIEPIELFLVGGFLGSGKTTFLRQMIMQLGDAKLGLLVNEFGSIGIDAPLLQGEEIQLVEINNGSVFCACIGHGFTKTLKAFSEQPIDVLLIESSGMADPSSMNLILEQMKAYVARPYDYKGLITLVDATSFEDYIDVILPLQNQIAAADLILINKEDLVSAQTIESVRTIIREYQDEAPVLSTSYGRISLDELRDVLREHGRVSPSYNTPENRPESWTLIATDKQTIDGMRAFAKALAADVWRIKGFVQQDSERWIHVDATGRHIVVTALEASITSPFSESRLVVIGEHSDDSSIKEKVERAWTQYANGSVEFRY